MTPVEPFSSMELKVQDSKGLTMGQGMVQTEMVVIGFCATFAGQLSLKKRRNNYENSLRGGLGV